MFFLKIAEENLYDKFLIFQHLENVFKLTLCTKNSVSSAFGGRGGNKKCIKIVIVYYCYQDYYCVLESNINNINLYH